MRIKVYKQTGKTNAWLDMQLPGWRKSKKGKRYFEARKNRSDRRGRRI